MILSFGNMSAHAELNWYMVELRSEKTIESTLRRLGQALPQVFQDSAVEVFIPVADRDLNKFELTTGSYIYVRSPNFQRLARLKKTVIGIVGLLTAGESNHPSQAIPIENSYVQSQIALAEEKFLSRAEAIGIDTFVRILDGDMRDWCGYVTNIHDGVAIVRIAIKTKVILVETPVRNLIDKSDVPDHLRVFYYGDLVADLDSNGLAHLIADDLTFEEDAFYTDDGLDVQKPKRHSRQQTVTALVKRLIVTGTHDPATIGREVLQALREGGLKRPRNMGILHGVIKTRLIEDFFRKTDPTVKNYRDVIERFGAQYKFSITDLAALDPDCGIPMNSEDSSDDIQDFASENGIPLQESEHAV